MRRFDWLTAVITATFPILLAGCQVKTTTTRQETRAYPEAEPEARESETEVEVKPMMPEFE